MGLGLSLILFTYKQQSCIIGFNSSRAGYVQEFKTNYPLSGFKDAYELSAD
jgi:hypothetical protein